MPRDDQQLIADYLAGDGEALAELVRRWLKPVYAFTYRLIGNAAEAEDVTQETFMKIWKNRKRYRPGQSFKAWLFTIARNTAIDWLRKRKDFTFSDFENGDGENALLDTLADLAPLPDELLAQVEDRRLLDDALAKLPFAYREVLLLHYVEELTFDEIGQALGKPLNTVKSQHRRAIAALRRLLAAPK